ncbi:SET domain-containing protein-lysine N-methyltransferase [bacterium]|nr:SET domain-containing protein-lysine N-methyltransferase [bacterium]
MRYKLVALRTESIAVDTRASQIEYENGLALEFKYIQNIGLGVFAKKAFQPGELVVRGIQIRPATKSIHSITGPDGNEYIYNSFAETINHNCDPNTGPYSKDSEQWNWYARRPIEPGQEITWAYDWTESVIGHFNLDSPSKSQCLCGSEGCRSPLTGFSGLTQSQRNTISLQKADLKTSIRHHDAT